MESRTRILVYFGASIGISNRYCFPFSFMFQLPTTRYIICELSFFHVAGNAQISPQLVLVTWSAVDVTNFSSYEYAAVLTSSVSSWAAGPASAPLSFGHPWEVSLTSDPSLRVQMSEAERSTRKLV